jgi:hypothetical protein
VADDNSIRLPWEGDSWVFPTQFFTKFKIILFTGTKENFLTILLSIVLFYYHALFENIK